MPTNSIKLRFALNAVLSMIQNKYERKGIDNEVSRGCEDILGKAFTRQSFQGCFWKDQVK